MENKHARTHRVAIRIALCALALGGFSLSQAQTTAGLTDFQKFMAVVNGNTTTVGIATNGTPVAVTAQSGLPTGSGWNTAGNYGAAKAASVANGVSIAGKGNIALGAGRTAAVTVSSGVTAANLVKGFRAMSPLGLTIVATPYILNWMTASNVSLNPAATGPANQFLITQTNLACTPTTAQRNDCTNTRAGYPGVFTACDCFRGGSYPATLAGLSNTNFMYWGFGYNNGSAQFRSSSSHAYATTSTGLPASMDDIAPYMQATQPDVRVVGEMLKSGVKLDVNAPTVTGPATVAGPTSTSTAADGKVTTVSNTHNLTYNDNRVTNNVTTTTSVYNPSTGTTVVEQTKTEEAEEPEQDQCEKNPDSVGCSELDTPEGEVPRATETVSFTPETPFGEGSCPADVIRHVALLGQTVKVWDWTKTCELSLPLRALVISLATLAALLIAFPTKVET